MKSRKQGHHPADVLMTAPNTLNRSKNHKHVKSRRISINLQSERRGGEQSHRTNDHGGYQAFTPGGQKKLNTLGTPMFSYNNQGPSNFPIHVAGSLAFEDNSQKVSNQLQTISIQQQLARNTLSKEITRKFADKLRHFHPGLKPTPMPQQYHRGQMLKR